MKWYKCRLKKEGEITHKGQLMLSKSTNKQEFLPMKSLVYPIPCIMLHHDLHVHVHVSCLTHVIAYQRSTTINSFSPINHPLTIATDL